MSVLKMTTLVKVLATAGLLAPGLQATDPLGNDVSTETLVPQEIGTMTAEGSLVYSMNVCTVVHSTNCEVSLSTGAAVETTEYAPVPTEDDGNGEVTTTDEGEHWTDPNASVEPTEGAGETGGDGASTTDVPAVTDSESVYPSASVTEDVSTGSSATDGEVPSDTPTESAPPSEETAAAAHVGAPAFMIGALVACLI